MVRGSGSGRGEQAATRLRVVGLAAVALPPLLIAALLGAWGVDLPYWDEWNLVELLDRSETGRLRLADLTAPANEHRIVVPRLVLLGLARLTGWNVRVELLASVAVMLLALLACDRLVRRLALRPGARWTVLALGSAILFSPSQAGNWAWGYQLVVFTCCATSLWTVVLLTGRRLGPGLLAAAVAAGWIATFSFAAGLAVWPVGVLALLRRSPPPWRLFVGWCAAAALAVLAFLWGHPGPGEVASGASAAPVGLTPYALALLGAPAVPAGAGFAAALLAAIAGLLVWALALWRAAREAPPADEAAATPPATDATAAPRLSGALVLLLLAAAVALLVAWGRAGRADATSERYLTLGNLFWLSVLLAGAAAIDSLPRARMRRASAVAATLVALVALAGAAIPGVRALEGQRHARALVRAQLRAGDIHPVALDVAYPRLDALQHWSTRLCDLGLGIYRDLRPPGCRICWIPPAQPPAAPVRASEGGSPALLLADGRRLPLHAPNTLQAALGPRRERPDGRVELRGWAATAERSHPASRVVALGPGGWIPQRYTRTTRRTLARQRDDRCLANAGFRIELLGAAPPAPELRLFALFADHAVELAGSAPEER
ncbi:MAG TPA: hypothetical protein VMV46_21675 [Thermoanaerobaculia bacterium]|nr:hypothetical protein [Thermoanaerobaculia bacterium]